MIQRRWLYHDLNVKKKEFLIFMSLASALLVISTQGTLVNLFCDNSRRFPLYRVRLNRRRFHQPETTMKSETGEFSNKFICSSSGCVMAILLLLGCLGCGPTSPTDGELADWVQHQIGKTHTTLAFKSVDAIARAPQGDGSVKFAFQVNNVVNADVYRPISIVQAYESYSYDPAEFVVSKQAIAGLREPERSVAVNSLPTQTAADLQIFQRVASRGDKVSWSGSVVARYSDTGWNYSEIQGQPDSHVTQSDTRAENNLPEGAVMLVPDATTNAILEQIAQQKQFIQAVAHAEKAMKARLQYEHQALLDLIISNRVLFADVRVSATEIQKLKFQVVHQENDGQKVAVLIEDANDKLKRATWSGSLKLTELPKVAHPSPSINSSSRLTPDGWSLQIGIAEGEDRFPNLLAGRAITVAVPLRSLENDTTTKTTDDESAGTSNNASDRFVLHHQDKSIPLSSSPSSLSMPEYTPYAQRITGWTNPGQVWEGTIQYQGDVSHKVRLTFTQVRDQGNYVRAILETPTDVHAVAVFEGTVSTDPAHAYSWPVRLKWISGMGSKFSGTQHEIRMITSGGNIQLAFSPSGECFGVSQSSNSLSWDIVFALEASEPEPDATQLASRWVQGLQPQSRWSGKIVRGDQPADKIMLTICEANANDQSYRMTFENPDNPQQFRYFAGLLNTTDQSIDTYALTLEARSSVAQPTFFGYSGYADLFGIHRDAKHRFRMTSNGKLMFGMTGANELVYLARDPSPVAEPLDRESRKKLWQDACLASVRWRGQLKNVVMQQSTDVEMRIKSPPDALGNIEVEILIPKQKKSNMSFKGVLQLLDNDVNGFALKFKKPQQANGQGPSLVFGNEFSEIGLQFRLNVDGSKMFGMATNGFGESKEFLDLTKVEVAK
jgi:hypothetical protein